MVKFDIPDIKKNLPMSMTMAAFSGIAWYIAIELNMRLFYLFKRHKGTLLLGFYARRTRNPL
jgi:hypothetical protein